MAKVILVIVGERPGVFKKLKAWRSDLSDTDIEVKMRSLPSTIINNVSIEVAQNCKIEFEACIGTVIRLE